MGTMLEKMKKTKGYKSFHENIITVHSKPKMGKTTLFAQFPDTVILDTEEGTGHVIANVIPINSWLEFTTFVKELKSDRDKVTFRTIVIDTVSPLLRYCDEFISKKRGVSSVIEADDFGKTSAVFSREFSKQIRGIISLGFGLCLTAHAEEKIVKVDSITNPYAAALANPKGEVSMIVPALDRKPRLILLGLSDVIMYMDINKDGKRVLHTKPSHHFEAGSRTNRFPDTIEIPLTGAYDLLISLYYKDSTNGDSNGKQEIIERLNTAEQYLAQHQIDNFDQPIRVENSRKKHLKVGKFEDADIVELEAYLQHLRIKATNAKKNGETNAQIPSNK